MSMLQGAPSKEQGALGTLSRRSSQGLRQVLGPHLQGLHCWEPAFSLQVLASHQVQELAIVLPKRLHQGHCRSITNLR
eukprot:2765207-Rhodomonas_salina.3